MKILVVDDDEQILTLIRSALSQQNYIVDVATDGEMGWGLLEANPYALVLLDVILPKLNGIELCRRLRNQKNKTPILMLTARGQSTDKVLGLDTGADDYVVKPFDIHELVARVRALLRRGVTTTPILECGPLQFNPSSQEITYGGQKLNLRPKELSLLELFLRHQQRVFSRQAILDHLWSLEDSPNDSTVKAHIRGIRQAFQAVGANDPIETLYGQGYRLNSAFLNSRTLAISEPVSSLTSPANPDLSSSVQQVWQHVQEQSWQRVLQLQTIVQTWRLVSRAPDSLQQATTIAHQLAGVMGSFGFDAASKLAKCLEYYFSLNPSSTLEVMQVEQLVRELRQLVEQAMTKFQPTPPQEVACRVLLISRNPTWLNEIVTAAELTHLGWQFDRCSPTTVHQPLSRQHPDVIVLELSQSHRQTDWSLLATLANNRQLKVAICVVAETDDASDHLQAAQKGAQVFLCKSCSSATKILQTLAEINPRNQLASMKALAMTCDTQWFKTLNQELTQHSIKIHSVDTPAQFWDSTLR